MTNLEAALKYASKGWKVFPCNVDKTPMTINGKDDATTDSGQIKRWWDQHPEASIGMACGKESGVWVLDIDMPEGPKSLSEIEKQNERIPKTLAQRTGGGGIQYFWKWNGNEVRNRTRIKPNLDVRGEGGYVILPPSGHPSGGNYSWAQGAEITEAPGWLVHLVLTQKKETQQDNKSSYGQAALAGEIMNVLNSVHGCRNDTLNSAAFKLGQLVSGGELTREEVEGGLLGAALGKELSAKEIRATIKSGIEAGMLNARSASKLDESVETVETVESVEMTPPELKELKSVENQLKTQLKTEITFDTVKEWILLDKRRFTLQDAYRDFNCRNSYERKIISTYLGRLKAQNLIENDGSARGVFNCTSKEKESSIINIFNTETGEWLEEVSFLDIYYPLGLDGLVGLLPGNIVVVAGESNAGKTALLLDWAFHNLKSSKAFTSRSSGLYDKVHYFSSEMGSSELTMRARAFGYPAAAWSGFTPYERSEDFHQVIDPDGLNFVDFLEIHDEFYKVGAKIRAIHETLKSGLCVIALQKKTGKDMGRGGEMSLEKPRLYISLSEAVKGVVSVARIIKAKNYKTSWNPNGMQIDFKIEGKGSRVNAVSEWRFLSQSEREIENRKYELQLGVKKAEEYNFKLKSGKEVVLRAKDTHAWIEVFTCINVEKELLRLSQNSFVKPWMGEDWFYQLGGFLQKKNKEAGGK